ncbi:cobalt ABC transporter ATP-binding protein [Flexivirga endophytica]|uniref:Cobalt ABC transporter ATP-binding protein n=1 Tax=Flexivirga endophytica TaxID=1849103 RepID=A0A916T2X5_9MICO|nr:ABC transporter ATP-binding protein [Flexivirga endophytica]GGB25778.1 cobalt ABC transporter ATP-binding protein [Flexivirga endophytica]GHB54374.1 cobalt ABC transporter ATP-binding protein [Flexivirga endophytica]
MIELRDLSIRYADDRPPELAHVDLHIEEGELALVIGRTGVGKSTLLGAINGLVPHFTGGRLSGNVVVAGMDTRDHPPREMADVVGRVGQDPVAGFVADTVEDELAYGMEQLGVAPATMRKRVEETLDLLGIAALRGRSLATLSGGQQQRVAIGSALVTAPRVLVLDEPTSALDPGSAEEVLAAITRLVHDLGTTVVMAEHRLERAVQYADSVIAMPGGGVVRSGDPATMMIDAPVAPPVVELGRLCSWTPLPLSVRDARRAARPLRGRLADPSPRARPAGDVALRAKGVTVQYRERVAVRDVTLQLAAGTVTALMGRNGSGKSSLLWSLQGSGPRSAGSVLVDGVETSGDAKRGSTSGPQIGLVPQTAADLLYLESVGEECAAAGPEARALLDHLAPGIDDGQHPRDLSEGQRLSLVLAIQLAGRPRVLLLDEPTRGLDYTAKALLTQQLDTLARDGHAVLVATHDVEFVAGLADRVVVLADGDVIADGPTADVVASSPIFAPQVAKVLAPQEFLTVRDVARALGDSRELG